MSGGTREGGEGARGPHEGWSSPEVQLELSGLRLLWAEVESRRATPLTADSPADVQERLRGLSSRFRGARAVGIRREPIPAAYRVFYRQIGLDPDVERTPIEEAVLERMVRGGFPSGGLIADVMLIAMLDTGVPVWALDGAWVDGPLGVRASIEGEALGRSPGPPLPAGRLVVADSTAALALLFSQVAPGHEPSAQTRSVSLFAVQVQGVPTLYVEEALWACQTALEQP
jgi:DNA/RNA-binding domain of Phe-tRNA-synthetase-like protein